MGVSAPIIIVICDKPKCTTRTVYHADSFTSARIKAEGEGWVYDPTTEVDGEFGTGKIFCPRHVREARLQGK